MGFKSSQAEDDCRRARVKMEGGRGFVSLLAGVRGAVLHRDQVGGRGSLTACFKCCQIG